MPHAAPGFCALIFAAHFFAVNATITSVILVNFEDIGIPAIVERIHMTPVAADGLLYFIWRFSVGKINIVIATIALKNRESKIVFRNDAALPIVSSRITNSTYAVTAPRTVRAVSTATWIILCNQL